MEKLTEEQIINLGKIDLLIGGSPCQSLSCANSNLKEEEKGLNGTGKSNLFWKYVRIFNILKKTNPNLKFLLENVGSARLKDRAIISHELGVEGINFNSNLLSAQNRNRIYWTNITFEIPKERKSIFMKDIKEENVSDKYYLTEKTCNYVMTKRDKGWNGSKIEIDLDIARTILATMHKLHRADTDNYISTEYKPLNRSNIRKFR